MNYPYNISGSTISVFFNDRMHTVDVTDDRHEALFVELTEVDHDYDILQQILEMPKAISRLTAGMVEATATGVTYAGVEVHSVLASRLVEMIQSGMDATPWANFLNKIMENPSYRSRECLFNFLEKFAAPLTPDGNFLAFKMVRDNYLDQHTGTIDNSVGKVVWMDRRMVNDDPNQTCSAGLHACASEYLSGYSFGPRTMVVEINPKDVVSVPADYNFSKMRVCSYKVIAEITRDQVEEVESKQVIGSEYWDGY